jgi:hypothetical protein
MDLIMTKQKELSQDIRNLVNKYEDTFPQVAMILSSLVGAINMGDVSEWVNFARAESLFALSQIAEYKRNNKHD